MFGPLRKKGNIENYVEPIKENFLAVRCPAY